MLKLICVMPIQTWISDGGVYKLVTCPTGYSKIRNENEWENQMCDPCLKGQECKLTTCETCTECLEGHYKAVIGTEACEACPANTYRKGRGGTALSVCLNCPAGADTKGEKAKTSIDDCKCSNRMYSTTQTPFTCSTCPAGAVCSVILMLLRL